MKQRDEKRETRKLPMSRRGKRLMGHLCGAGADNDGRSHNCICSG